MKIVKRIFRGGIASDIPREGLPFEHEQSNLIAVDPIIIGDFIYWVVTIQYPDR